MNTPLLAADEPNAVPSLGALSSHSDPDANSALTRMLRDAPVEDSSQQLQLSPVSNNSAGRRTARALQPANRNHRTVAAVSFVTIAAGSLTLIETGLFWGSFLSRTWVSTHLLVQTFLSSTPLDTVLQVLDLGTIVNAFVATNHAPEIAIFAVTTILIPCFAMIWQPMIILERHQAILTLQSYQVTSNHLIRLSFLVVFAILIVDTCVAGVKLSLVNAKVSVQNEFGPGMWSYTIGCCLSVLSVMLLRVSCVKKQSLNTNNSPEETMEDGYMRILEEEALMGTDEGTEQVSEPAQQSNARCFCLCSRRLVLFESALLSIIFGIVACLFPLYSVAYDGVASDFMTKSTMTVDVKNLLLANDILPRIALAQVLLFPMLSFLSALTASMFDGVDRSWLASFHSGANSFSLCAAILLIIPAIHSLGKQLLDEQAFCASVEVITGDSCISLTGSIGAGTWLLLAHAVSLEVFVQTTLWKTSL